MLAHSNSTCPDTNAVKTVRAMALGASEDRMTLRAVQRPERRFPSTPVDSVLILVVIYSRPIKTPSCLYPEKKRSASCARWEGGRSRLQTRGPVEGRCHR